jgi:hypothetical protein
VLKAVQDYKDETSTEVTTETDYSSESTDSGTIANQNDELSVSFLFYELQKRYRVSEKIYRVMPVVFVAQEVPSPDQITPAWIISNDWILNRYLLDDSFRPTLRYLANNSVGDDFSLRELRKNKTLQVRLDNETKVKRLQVHLRNNIFYYMQAIWSMEPPDQRYLRLYKVQVPVIELESRSYRVKVQREREEDDIFAPFREPGTEKHRAFLHGKLKRNPTGAFNTKPLVELADLDTLLGFKGNYMIFPMKQHNALTEFMAAPYIDSAFGAMDPEEMSNVNLDEYSKYVCCRQTISKR